MLFNSLIFAIFLPVVFLLYWFVCGPYNPLLVKNQKPETDNKSNRWLTAQNMLIVVASYVFYGWWDWRFLILIAFTTICSFFSGIIIGNSIHNPDRKSETRRKLAMWGNITINIGILATFKYYNFFVTELARLFGIGTDHILLNVILPVGISFYTFQALSYTIDVYRGKIEATHDIVAFFAFISFFPQLVAGPIERATNLLPQFLQKRTFSYEQGIDGMRQILWGLFKKMVVADNCAVYVNRVFSDYANQSASTLLLAAVFFTFQIYGDFSGYSDIAIGTAKLFGIKLMRNFNVPYFSRDIAEFWRRWHISLTTWFRDYVYIPLGGSRPEIPEDIKHPNAYRKFIIARNTFVIFLVSGLWHGANWTFVVWGLYHAMLFMPLILLGKNRKYTDTVACNDGKANLLPSPKEFAQMLLTFALAVIGWIIFRAENISQAWGYIAALFSKSIFTVPHLGVVKMGIILSILIVCEWLNRNKDVNFFDLKIHSKYEQPIRSIIWGILLIIIILLRGKYQEFIYFQF